MSNTKISAVKENDSKNYITELNDFDLGGISAGFKMTPAINNQIVADAEHFIISRKAYYKDDD
jgi:hypothetical protein